MRIALAPLLIFLATFCMAQNREFTVVTYNSLRYSPTNIDARHPDLRLIMNDIQPDILCVQELNGAAAAQMYMDSVLNVDSSTYAMATFLNGNDLDVSLYYKQAKFSFVSTQSYPTALRDIYHYQLIPDAGTDTLHIFGLHLKASTGSSNQQARKAEIDVLRQITDQFRAGTYFLVTGDFNIYSANEPGYARLLQDTPNNDGHFEDPFSLSGTWNNASYAPYHTQSPRATAFNGGASGGMDDRFDMVLFSESLMDTSGMHYVPNSMYAYGNDGLHYDQSINSPPTNAAVSQALADALYYASDHLPVIAKIAYPVSNVSIEEFDKVEVSISTAQGGFRVQNPKNLSLKGWVYGIDGQRLRPFEVTSSQLVEMPLKGVFVVSISNKKGRILMNQLLLR